MRFVLFLGALVFVLSAPAAENPWIIGTRHVPPFAIKQADGSWTGLSVELWETIADELGVDYEWREIGSPDAMIDGVANGDLGAAVAALSVTAERTQRVDFSQPFYDSGLAIAVGEAGSGWGGVIRSIFSWAFLNAMLALAAVLLLAAMGVWLFERRRNSEQFGGTSVQGLGAAFWWSAVTMTTVGYGDKAPQTIGGRVVALIWMFASIIIISGFTATIASSLTAARVTSRVQQPTDLPRVVSATVGGSTAQAYLENVGARFLAFGSVDEALAAVEDGSADAAVYDEPLLRYRARERVRVVVLPGVFQPQDYAIALPVGSPLRKTVNVALLERLNSDWWRERKREYLGQ